MKCGDATPLSPHRAEAERMGPGLLSPRPASSSPSPALAPGFRTTADSDVTDAARQGVTCASVRPPVHLSTLSPTADGRPLGVGLSRGTDLPNEC